MSFPLTRMRRLRKNKKIREMFSETNISINDLIMPLFIKPGRNQKEAITSMPGQYRWSIDTVVKECKEIQKAGIRAVLLFGLPCKKDISGKEAYSSTGIVQKAIKAIKKNVPDLIVIADVCLCEYTSHGHCGIIKKGVIDNDATLNILGKISLSLAHAGADIIAPSDMMDGRVKYIRELLDTNGFMDTPIMSYAAKYSSSFYGPFREAAFSEPKFGDRKSYQMSYTNQKEALREIELDIQEGADIVMIKPALSYLDIISMTKQKFNIPIAAYNVSGAYSMIKAAASKKFINEKETIMEITTSIKRAGADVIITYFAKDIAQILKDANK